MVETEEQVDVSALFDWSISCDYQEVEMCGTDDTHDAHWMLHTKCSACGMESVRAICDSFWQTLVMYLEWGPGVNCRGCKTYFDRDELKPEPLKGKKD